MGNLANLRLSTRMQLLVGLTLVGLIVLCVTALFQLKDTMLEDRKQKTQNLVEVAHGVLNHYHRLSQQGTLADEEARKAARETLRELRYGQNDYFFILDTSHRYVLLPPKPENEGKDVADLKDVNGKPLIRDLVSAAQAGGGFVDYWFPKPGASAASPKLSYANKFGPWNWVIGTGIYIDDVDAEYRHNAMLLGGIALLLLVALTVIGFLVGHSVTRQLGGEPKVVAEIMQQVAAGDLTVSANNPLPGSLMHSLAAMVASLRTIVTDIRRDADTLVGNAEQIATASDQVARAAEHQSDSTSAMAAAIEQLTVSSSHISDSARETSTDSRQAVEYATQGEQRVGKARDAIQRVSQTVTGVANSIHALEDRAKQISSIANVIKEIAGQTNLLALNAAIEAARAGEQGRGFAVVADEVRKLAERTSLATTEIEQMIVAIQDDTTSAVDAMNAALPEVEQGVELAESATESLRAIEEGAQRTLERIGEVADATLEQSSASTSIAQRVEQIAHMVEETTTTIRGTTATAHQLEDIANNLKGLIGRFRV